MAERETAGKIRMRVLAAIPVLAAAVAALPQAPPGWVWCYRTLADVVCYPRPDPEHPDRLVGVAPCAAAGSPDRSGCLQRRAGAGMAPGVRRDTENR